MEKKRSKARAKGKAKGKKAAVDKIKTNVRLFKAEDLIWAFLLERMPGLVECEKKVIDAEGFRVKMMEEDGGGVYVEKTWVKVAEILGKDKCELVLNPDAAKYLLLYDEEDKELMTEMTQNIL